MILWAFLRRYLSKQKKRSWFKSLVKVDCFLNRFSLWSYSGAESVMLSDTSMCLTAFGWYYCQRDKIEIDFISVSADFTFHRHRRKQKVAVILFPFQQFFFYLKGIFCLLEKPFLSRFSITGSERCRYSKSTVYKKSLCTINKGVEFKYWILNLLVTVYFYSLSL